MRLITTLVVLTLAAKVQAQTNAIQLCDQQATRHCLTITAPSSLSLSPAPVMLSGKSGALLVGMASTDLSLLAGAVVSPHSFVSASSPTNAAVISMAATAGGGGDLSIGKTGTATLGPMRFYRNPNEIARFDTNDRLLLGLTASDVSSGVGSMVASASIVVVTGATNASVGSFAAIAGNYVALNSGITGSGTYLPFALFTSATERLRVDTGGFMGVGVTPTPVFSGVFNTPQVTISQSDATTGSINSKGPLVLYNPNATTGNLASILFAQKGSDGNIYGNAQITAEFTEAKRAGYGATDLVFLTNTHAGPAERMRLDSGGHLLVGATTAYSLLQVRTGTDQNVGIEGPVAVATGNTFNIYNDAHTANVPLEIRSSLLVAGMVGNVVLGAATTSGSYKLDVTGAVNSTVGYASPNSASNTVNIPNGGLLALNGTFGSISNYIIVQGTSPQINAGSLGAAFNISSSSTVNGNVVFNLANVTGLSSVQINGHNNGTTSTQTLILNEVTGGGGGITIEHGGSFDAAWQAGSGAAFDVVSNNGSSHRLVVLHNGQTLVGRTTDDGTGSLFEVNGAISVGAILGTTIGGSTITASVGFASTNSASNTVNIPNGGILATNGTFGASAHYVIIQNSAPQVDATSLNAAFNINSSSTTNGNIVFNLGAVTGLSSFQVNGHNNASPTTQTLILNEVSGGGGGITMKHGGTFDAAWQAGTGAAFDVLNSSSFHVFVMLHSGVGLVGRTSDNGTGTLFQIQGGLSIVGTINANGNAGGSSTITIRNSAGTGTCTITYSGGVFISSTC